jgi:hypothetical protein
MSRPIAFTDNVSDLSNQNGYQFEFRCERCGNGYRSAFQSDALSTGRKIIDSMGSLFGGRMAEIGNVASEWAVNRGTNSAAKDKALDAAVDEIRDRFKQCRACGDWRCAEVCWNDRVGQCLTCSPLAEDDLAQLQAEARRTQMREALTTTDLIGRTDLRTPSVVRCPTCSAEVGSGKFCAECGADLRPTTACSGCGHRNDVGAKFCSECGSSL